MSGEKKGEAAEHWFSLELLPEPGCSLNTALSVYSPSSEVKLEWVVLKRPCWYVVSVAAPRILRPYDLYGIWGTISVDTDVEWFFATHTLYWSKAWTSRGHKYLHTCIRKIPAVFGNLGQQKKKEMWTKTHTLSTFKDAVCNNWTWPPSKWVAAQNQKDC